MPNKILPTCLLTLLTALTALTANAQAKKQQRDSATFARLILATKEFKQEKHKMDSVFKATNRMAVAAFEIQMDEMPDKADKEDKEDKPTKPATPGQADPEDNFMTATIVEQQGAANVIMYELKYDRKKHQIVSVHPTSDGLDLSVDSD